MGKYMVMVTAHPDLVNALYRAVKDALPFIRADLQALQQAEAVLLPRYVAFQALIQALEQLQESTHAK